MNTAKSMTGHGFSQFRLTSQIVTKLADFDITPTAKLVLLYLSTCYNPNKADMFPKQKTIAQKIGISERSVVRAISELFKTGLIIIECKYTNRYKFTSKIDNKQPQNDKKFYSDNMASDSRQNDTSQHDNLSLHEYEPIKELNKEPEKVEDYKILKAYATKMGAKNINRYIEALKRNSSAQKIINEYKSQERITKRAKENIEEMSAYIEQAKQDAITATSYEECKAWKEFGEKIKTISEEKSERVCKLFT